MMVLPAFSALCVYSTFGHHPDPRLPLCQISCLRDLHCWASSWKKSLTHSTSL